MEEEEERPVPGASGAPPQRPLVVVDGANVIRGSTQSSSLQALLICDHFWRRHGFPCVSLLPMGMEAQAASAEEVQWVSAARACGCLVLVPCRERGADDLFSISLAVQHDGFLVSNDRFADHTRTIAASSGVEQRAVEEWLAKRVVTFAWGGAVFLPHPLSLNLALGESRKAPATPLGIWAAVAGPAPPPPAVLCAPAPQPPLAAPENAALAATAAVAWSGSGMGGGGGGRRAAVQCHLCGEFGHIRIECPKLECFNCGGVGVGHMSSQCPFPRKQGPVCWRCGEAGHTRAQCGTSDE